MCLDGSCKLIGRFQPLVPLTYILLVALLPVSNFLKVRSFCHLNNSQKQNQRITTQFGKLLFSSNILKATSKEIIFLKIINKMETQRKVHLHCYKTGAEITSTNDLPVPSELRTSTDVFCTIVTSIFAIAMFVIALVCLNMPALQKMTYPTDSQSRHCTLDNANYNYIYFPTPNNADRRVCVSQCPTGNENTLSCWPTDEISCSANSNHQFEVVIYPTTPTETSTGLFCFPTDETLRNNLLNQAHLQSMLNFVSAYKSIGVSLLSGLGLGIIAVLLFSFLPTATAYASIVLGGIGCLVLAILLFVSKSDTLAIYKVAVYIFAFALVFIGVILLYGVLFRSKDIALSISYLKEASICVWEAPALLLLSFVFIALLTGLIALCTFQVLAYWSSSNMVVSTGSIYVRPEGAFSTWMTVLTAIEFFWGLCFLKEVYNFLFSGVAVIWHFTGKHSLRFPLVNLFRFHWGSVAGGAFLLHALYPLDLLYDLCKPSPHSSLRAVCCCCERLLDLARSEAMALVNMLAMPYCNAARLCEQIVYYSSYTQGTESANRFVRIGGHVLFAGLATLIGWIYMQANGSVSLLAVALTFLLNIFNLTFFICILKNVSEALLFCDLIENCLDNREQIAPGPAPIAKKLFNEGYEILRTEA